MKRRTDYSLVCLCALRYALPRHTYVTQAISDYIMNNIDKLHTSDIQVAIRDVESALKHDSSMWDCDRKVFEGLLSRLWEELRTRENGEKQTKDSD